MQGIKLIALVECSLVSHLLQDVIECLEFNEYCTQLARFLFWYFKSHISDSSYGFVEA